MTVIEKEIFPLRGKPKQRAEIVVQALSSIHNVGKGTGWPLEGRLRFCEYTASFLKQGGQLGDELHFLLLEVYDAVIEQLNELKPVERISELWDRVMGITVPMNPHYRGSL